MSDPIIDLRDVSKTYGGLRPLRIRRLSVEAGVVLGLAGFDQTTAEVLVNLVTGAMLPEEGTVRVFGRATAEIADSADWLSTVDHFGIVSERVVLLEQFSPLQNIAMSLTLDVEPLPPDIRARADHLARDVGLDEDTFDRPIAGGHVALRHRVRLARALAASPSVLLVEHPLAGLDAADIAPLAADLQRVAAERQLAMLVLAADPSAAAPFAKRVLGLNGGTGDFADSSATGLLGRIFRRSS